MRTIAKRILSCLLVLLMCGFATFTYADGIESGYQIRKVMANADNSYCSRQGKQGQLKQEGGCSVWSVGSWVEFKVNIPQAGTWRIGINMGCDPGFEAKHDISIDGNLVFEAQEAVPIEGSFQKRQDLVITNLTFDESGEYTIRIDYKNGTACYSYDMFLTYLGEPIELTSVTADGADIMASEDVSCGADNIKAEFTSAISAEALTGDLYGKVSLKDSENNEIPLIGKVNENILTICLTEALTADETYTLDLIEIPDDMDFAVVAGENFTFTAKEGDGSSKIAETDVYVYGEDISLSAKMLSSENVGIKGRNYSVYVTYEDEEKGDIPVFEGISETGGLISETYSMPEGSNDGTYNFIFCGDYVDEETVVSVIYVTAVTKAQIAESIKNCETAEEVEAILTDATNALYIGIDPAKEIGTLKKAQVYTHFIGKDIEFDNLKSEFRKFIAVETLRQSNTAIKMRKALNNKDVWNKLGLDKGMFDEVANPGAVVTALIKASSVSDADEYISNLVNVLNAELLLTYEKTDLTLDFEDVSAYVNQGVYVPIVFCEDVSEIFAIELKLTVSDEEMLSTYDLVLDEKSAIVEKEQNEEIVDLSFVFENLTNSNGIGKISIQIPSAEGTYKATLSGKVFYAPAESNYMITAEIKENEMEIEAKEKPSSKPVVESQRPSSGGGGSKRPSGGSGSVVAPSQPENKPVQEEVYSFSDVAKEHWAYESVDYLVKHGIIEKTADKKYNPDEKMAREEIVKMMVLALGLTDENAVSNLSDVTKNNPYYKYIASAEKYGIIYGNDSGQFMIGKPVTREDICVILHRAVEKVYSFKGDNALFADDSVISAYAKKAVYDMKSAGIINGVGENTFMPKGDVTRAQASKMIYEIVKAVGR